MQEEVSKVEVIQVLLLLLVVQELCCRSEVVVVLLLFLSLPEERQFPRVERQNGVLLLLLVLFSWR